MESTCGAAITTHEVKVEVTACWEVCGEVLVRLEEEGSSREWILAKIAVDVGGDIALVDMRGVGTAVVSKEGAKVHFRNDAEVAVLMVQDVEEKEDRR